MRHALEPDHDLLGDDEAPRDLVLGAPALLGIFLAVVLVCAVCFGFGYSSGHGFQLGAPAMTANVPTQAAPSTSSASTTPPLEADAADPEQAAEPAPPAAALDQSERVPERAPAKPAPGVESGVLPVPVPVPLSAATSQEANSPHAEASESRATTEEPASASTPQPATAGVAPNDATAATAPAQNLALMVQIAAVTQAADASTLARALRHDGYNAIVRTTTGDPYFHVQVGPFASYEAAKGMRARLASSGYTAFIRH